jgi:hypothetical protein
VVCVDTSFVEKVVTGFGTVLLGAALLRKEWRLWLQDRRGRRHHGRNPPRRSRG